MQIFGKLVLEISLQILFFLYIFYDINIHRINFQRNIIIGRKGEKWNSNGIISYNNHLEQRRIFHSLIFYLIFIISFLPFFFFRNGVIAGYRKNLKSGVNGTR